MISSSDPLEQQRQQRHTLIIGSQLWKQMMIPQYFTMWAKKRPYELVSTRRRKSKRVTMLQAAATNSSGPWRRKTWTAQNGVKIHAQSRERERERRRRKRVRRRRRSKRPALETSHSTALRAPPWTCRLLTSCSWWRSLEAGRWANHSP